MLELSKQQRIPHALLFTGPPSVGKRLVAFALAADILRRHSNTPGSADRPLQSGSHPDLHLVRREDEKKDISVESIRELRSSLQLQPFMGKAAVAVIDNAHEMTTAASNALLLTLEEPANGRFLFLVTHAPQRLPDTIVSRCQTVFLGELTATEVTNVLKQLFAEKLTEKSLAAILALTGSSIAALGLEQHVNYRTLELENPAAAWKGIAELLTRSETLSVTLRRIFSSENSLAGDALSVASLLSEEKGDDLNWLVLKNTIRTVLRNAEHPEATKYADLLLQALEAERLIRDRNANPQLQLSSLFLNASGN